MSRWTIKKQWYSHQQWVARRVISFFLVLVMLFGPGFPFAAFAGSDTFVGDSAIYVGSPEIRPKPKILFLIDNSQSTMNAASGARYYPSVMYEVVDSKDPWDIFYAKNTGDYDLLAVDNDSYALENLTSDSCADVIRHSLLTTGVYAGSGSPSAPNITHQGGCDTDAPNGVVYALGNFLSYTYFVTEDDDDLDGVEDIDDQCRGFDDVVTLYDLDSDGTFDNDVNGDGIPDNDLDQDGTPNAAAYGAGTPWEHGCDVCPGFDDRIDNDEDLIPDGCDSDDDNDGVNDIAAGGTDNCPFTSNPTQTDSDGDGQGDACDDDDDNDGVYDLAIYDPAEIQAADDNCRTVFNPAQIDDDFDGIGDACDPIVDTDFDNVDNATDNCLTVYNPDQEDLDLGVEIYNSAVNLPLYGSNINPSFGGDVCDYDDDNDGVADEADKCTVTDDSGNLDVAASDDRVDSDGDGVPDGCDTFTEDTDGDGIFDDEDNCIAISNVDQKNQDGDAFGDLCDDDIDGDGFTNNPAVDKCPTVASATNLDSDGDGKGDVCDEDIDGDTVNNADDLCPGSNDKTDSDQDSIPDACDDFVDTDGDGVEDSVDRCPGPYGYNPAFDDTLDADEDGKVDCDPTDDTDGVDTDKDGVLDINDKCPGFDDDDPTLDVDGDGIVDACDNFVDTDKDGVADTYDRCPGPSGPYDPVFDDTVDANTDGTPDCLTASVDSDGDTVVNDLDQCPGQDDLLDVSPANGIPDCLDDTTDSDSDGVMNNLDRCPGQDDTIDVVHLVGNPDCLDAVEDLDGDTVVNKDDICWGENDLTDVSPANGTPDCLDDTTDSDGDGVMNNLDRCSGVDDTIDVAPANGVPDCLDGTVDSDGDTVMNSSDQCPGQDDTIDLSPANGVPDCLDDTTDSDGDGVLNKDDLCPGFDDTIDISPVNGVPDCLDASVDIDGDGVMNSVDQCPGEDDTIDTTPANGVPDCLDDTTDSDGDGVMNKDDYCPAADDTIDIAPANGVPDCIDATVDFDGDGVVNTADQCPGEDDTLDVSPANTIPDCLDDTTDSDGDGVMNNVDQCPGSDDTIDANTNGIPDCKDLVLDADGDGVSNTADQCPGKDDTIDSDGDTIPDCIDPFIDTDKDGVIDSLDKCPGPLEAVKNSQYDDALNIDAPYDDIPDGCDSFNDSDNDGVENPYDSNGDGILDAGDKCPGFDDAIDIDNDSIPDDCDPMIDVDNDFVADDIDNCKDIYNPGPNLDEPWANQPNFDGDAFGDACDTDDDNDGVLDADEPTAACQFIAHDPLVDADSDGIPDACDDDGIDTDKDGKTDTEDNCPDIYNPLQGDVDLDLIGDVCDPDDDNDTVDDADDKCMIYRVDGTLNFTASDDRTDNDITDADGNTISGDGIPDGCDTDFDNDNIDNGSDNCSLYNPDQKDTDLDGIGDACETDRDGDGRADVNDNCPDSPGRSADQTDTDGDGAGDLCDTDDDDDGVLDVSDNCPLTYDAVLDLSSQADYDGDGIGDVCDTDDDDDGIFDVNDECLDYAGIYNSAVFVYDDVRKDTDHDGKTDCGIFPWTAAASGIEDECDGKDEICGCATQPPYTEMIVEVVNPKTNKVPWVNDTSGKTTKYRLIATHDAVDVSYSYADLDGDGENELVVGGNKPGWSYNWQLYWETVPDDTPVTLNASDAPWGWSAGKTYYIYDDFPCGGPTSSLEPEMIPIAEGSYDIEESGSDWLKTVTQSMPTASLAVASILAFFSFTDEEADAATQRSVMFDAIKMVVSSAYNSAHFGAMTYGPSSKGGRLVREIESLHDLTEVNDWLKYLPGGESMPGGAGVAAPTIPSASNRPQSSALYDAGYYFGANYDATDLDATVTYATNSSLPIGGTGGAYGITTINQFNPTDGNCGYNHVIVLTNGSPNNDEDIPMPTTIGDADGDNYPDGVEATADEGSYGMGSHYLDDTAYYLNKEVDLTPSNGRRGGDITVHTVLAFAPADPLLERAAALGGGEHYLAYNAQQLAQALNNLLVKIVAEEDTAFVAPVVPASTTNRTISSDRVYLGLFKPQTNDPWIGNIKKYRVTDGTQLLGREGGEATYPDTHANAGDFIPTSNSYWGTYDPDGVDEDPVDRSDDKIVCSDGHIPFSQGDGGVASCGGVGGTLAMRDLQAANDDSTVDTMYKGERFIYTFPPRSAFATASAYDAHPRDLTNNLNKWTTDLSVNPFLNNTVLGVDPSTLGREDIIRFVEGYDINSTVANKQRDWLLGDILHSRPVVFNYSSYTLDQENDCSENTSVIFVGANDGMLHAFRDCDGREMWGFIPPQILDQLKDAAAGEHLYLVDSPPVAYVHDLDNDGVIEANASDLSAGDRVVLVFGLRRGGSTDNLQDIANNEPMGGYFAIDVSIPDEPQMVFAVDSTTPGLEEMGQSWSQPRLAKVNINGADKVVAFVTGGYDKYEDLRYGQTQNFPALSGNTVVPYQVGDSGVSVLEEGMTSSGDIDVTVAKTAYNRGGAMYAIEVAELTGTAPNLLPDTSNGGDVVWSYDHDAGANNHANNPDLDYSIASDMTVGDTNHDGYLDVIYVGDTGGRMWRFDVSGSDVSAWNGEIIFFSNPGYDDFYTPYSSGSPSEPQAPTLDASDVGRKFFYKPAVAVINGKTHLWFGTGDRAHPLNHAVVDRLYKVVDNGQTTSDAISEKNLVDLTADPMQLDTYDTSAILEKLQNQAVGPNLEPDYYHGWLVKMDYDYVDNATSEVVGEKVLAAPVMFNQEAYFTTYAPSQDESTSDPCSVGNLGTSRLYHLDAHTAEAVFNYDVGNDSDSLTEGHPALQEDGTVLKRADRTRTLGRGIPSGIVTLIDASGRVTMMISSSNRVETYNAPDIKLITPVYWMRW